MQASHLNCFHCTFAALREKYCGWIPCSVFQKKVRCGSICFLFVNRAKKAKLCYS